jgi:glutamate-1-semialdehyde aminotransferase
MALGSPQSTAEDIVILDFDKESALEYIEANGHELAAVLIEPVQNRRPDLHPKEFLKKLRTLTEKTNTILIFDEILVGFRIDQGGAQAWADVKADMVTYGKIVGGGIPISVIGGRKEIMARVDGGTDNTPWSDRAETTYTAGTYVKNPLALAAMRSILTEMKEKGKIIQENLNANTDQLVEKITNVFNKHEVPFEIKAFGSFFRFSQAGNLSFVYKPVELDLFSYHMIYNGIYLWEGGTCFLSTAHTAEDIEKIVEAADKSIQQMLAGGFFGNKITNH